MVQWLECTVVLKANFACCQEFSPDGAEVDSGFHSSEASKLRTQIVGDIRLSLQSTMDYVNH